MGIKNKPRFTPRWYPPAGGERRVAERACIMVWDGLRPDRVSREVFSPAEVVSVARQLAAALDSAGYSIIAPVVPEIGDATGAGPGVMGALVASFAIGQMVGYPLAARVLQRRHAVAVLLVSLALVVVGVALAVAAGLRSTWSP